MFFPLHYSIVETITRSLYVQILHSENELGVHKVDSAMSRLRAVNHHVILVPHKVDFNAQNALEIVQQYDMVLDCTDNATTRYLVNDCCVLLKKVGFLLNFTHFLSESTPQLKLCTLLVHYVM